MFQLPLDAEHYLPFSGAANFGFDNVTMDWQDYGGMTLDHQVVAGYVTEDFYIGALGLSPLPVNISNFTDQYPSFLGTLRAKNHIPSSSYGYTAGASYHSFPLNAFGSLTLGGYDATRMDASKNLTIAGGSDSYRPMLLGIEKITSGSVELLEAPIITALNSLVSQMWFPISACQRFESAFGLVWNAANELYLVNETQHLALLAQNPNITFVLSTGSGGPKDQLIDITLPYAAFDLTAKSPYAGLNQAVYYFPLKRAANDTQYTLGRTFLQEAYMIADYERGALSLFPAVFPDSSVKRHLVPILPVVDITPADPHSGLSRTAVIGIVAGGIVILILVAAGTFVRIRCNRHEKKRKAVLEVPIAWEKAELASSLACQRPELEGHAKCELENVLSSTNASRDCTGSHESSAINPSLQEMLGDLGGTELCPDRQIYELPGCFQIAKGN